MDLALNELCAQWRLQEDECRLLAGRLAPDQLNWQPDGEHAWSVGQCLDHLRATMDAFGGAMRLAIAKAQPAAKDMAQAVRPGRPTGRFMREFVELPVKSRASAPKRIVPAEQFADAAALCEQLAESLAKMEALTQTAAGVDVNRVRFVNPLFPFIRFTVGAGLVIMAGHNRRHMAQAEQVRQRTGFPL